MATVQWASLPEELWKVVLAKLPLAQRIRCSSVSGKLHRAAVAATDHFELQDVQKHLPSITLWISNHSSNVSSIALSGAQYGARSFELRHLPCQALQQLQLEDISVQIGSSSNLPGVLQALKTLTKLQLRSCTVLDDSSSLGWLSALPSLQHLELKQPRHSNEWVYLELPPSVLQQLTNLTYLSVHLMSMATETLQHLSCLTGLHHFEWYARPDFAMLSNSSSPGFSLLTALTSISIAANCLDPAVLLPFMQLQNLTVRHHVDRRESVIVQEAGGMLLSCIARMPHLQHLSIENTYWDWPEDAAAYAALSTSSQLTQLEVDSLRLPAGVWHSVFPAGRRMPELKVLSVPPSGLLPQPSAMQAADVQCMVSCCPALRECRIGVNPASPPAPLSQLTGLTKLRLDGAGNASFQALRALTGLQSLHILKREVMPAETWLGLTALHRLTLLDASCYVGVLDPVSFTLQSGAGQDPVWLQLLRSCSLNSTCQSLLLQQLGEQSVQQQELNQQLQQRLHAQEQHTQQLQQDLAAASAQAGEAVELRGRVQALEGQVQQLLQALQNRV